MRKIEEESSLELPESNKTKPRSGVDDDLTSLTWLQDTNLLKGIHLHTSVAPPDLTMSAKIISKDAETKDVSDIEEPCVTPGNAHNLSTSFTSGGSLKHPFNVPYDPMVHTNSKPPFSFSCLIFMSIESSPCKALPVKEIYNWIVDHFPYYKNAPNGWKNSVRHNLSLNKCFRKVEKAPNVGKGSLWMVDAPFRPNLLHALEKAPYTFSRALKSAQYESSTRSKSPPSDDYDDFLSHEELNEDLSDVDAAAAMMVLKHGPHVSLNSDILSSISSRHRKSPPVKKSKLKETQSSTNGSDGPLPIQLSDEMLDIKRERDDSDYDASTDDAYAADEESNSSMTISQYPHDTEDEEQRKIEEGADALLNLAGITTSSTNNNNNTDTFNHNTSDEDVSFRKYASSNYSWEGVTTPPDEDSYKPRFIRRSYPNARKPSKRSLTPSEKVEKINKPKKIKLCKNVDKAKR